MTEPVRKQKSAYPDFSSIELPFKKLDKNHIHMKVKSGSKMRNILAYAFKNLEKPEVKQMVFTGIGEAMSKNISCVEIVKRKHTNLYQLNKLQSIQDTSCMHILLSKHPIDVNEPGYQAPGKTKAFWKKPGPKDSNPKIGAPVRRKKQSKRVTKKKN